MICVDASVAAKWVLTEPGSEKAIHLYREHLDATVIAPPFLPIEVTNAIRRGVVRREYDNSVALELLTAFLDFAVQLATPSGLYELALRLAEDYDRPAVYDMHYVALAQLAGCDLWTADQRLINALNGRMPFVKDLRTFDLPP